MLLLPVCFLSLIAGSLAVIGVGDCVDKNAGCLDCAKIYTITGSKLATPIGCFKSKGNQVGNALPYESLINHNAGPHKIKISAWENAGDADQIVAEFCGTESLALGYSYFGVEYSGECYFGFKDDVDKTKQGLVEPESCAKRCKWDVGGADTMMIYRVDNIPS